MWILLDTQIEKDPFSLDLFTLAHINIDVNIVLSSKNRLKEIPEINLVVKYKKINIRYCLK